MADHHLLRSRPTAATSVAVPDRSSSSELEVKLEYAGVIAAAGDVLPQAYKNRPGAVLLALEWADQRGVDILTTLQSVSFVKGRPVIDATMQRALAMRAGYEVKVELADGEQEARVTISRAGEVIGKATYSMADARTAELLGKDNWRKNPADMLVARATSRAMRRHAPDVMVGVYSEDELEEATPAEALAARTEATVDQLIAEPDEPVDADVIDVSELDSVLDGPCTDTTWAALVDHLEAFDQGDRDAFDSASTRLIGQPVSRVRQTDITEHDALELVQWEPR